MHTWSNSIDLIKKSTLFSYLTRVKSLANSSLIIFSTLPPVSVDSEETSKRKYANSIVPPILCFWTNCLLFDYQCLPLNQCLPLLVASDQFFFVCCHWPSLLDVTTTTNSIQLPNWLDQPACNTTTNVTLLISLQQRSVWNRFSHLWYPKCWGNHTETTDEIKLTRSTRLSTLASLVCCEMELFTQSCILWDGTAHPVYDVVRLTAHPVCMLWD